MSDFRFLRYADEADVVRITLTRPPLNILTIEMLHELGEALEAAAVRPALKALVLAAEGKAFCAGVAVEDHLGERARPMLETFHRIFRQLRALECVTLAAVQGAALGGGAELATFCDLVLAAESASFGQPEIKVGVFPPVAALHYPARIGSSRTLRLLLSGEVIGAPEAERTGLVDRVVPDALSAVVLRLTKRADGHRRRPGRPARLRREAQTRMAGSMRKPQLDIVVSNAGWDRMELFLDSEEETARAGGRNVTSNSVRGGTP